MSIRANLSAARAASGVDSRIPAATLKTAGNWPSVNPERCFFQSERLFSGSHESSAMLAHLSQCGNYRMERNAMQTKRTVGQFGSISSGTLLAEDLVKAFLGEAETLELSRKERTAVRKMRKEFDAITEQGDSVSYGDADDTLQDIASELNALLNEHAPAYGYFGAHYGDGADFGYWLSEDFEQQVLDDGGIKVNDLSEVPKGFTGPVLSVNDHGNATLYQCNNGRLREIWSIV